MNSFYIIFLILISIPFTLLLCLSFVWSCTPYRPLKIIGDRILEWHEPDKSQNTKHISSNDKCNCRFCKKKIMQDVKGNWYVVK